MTQELEITFRFIDRNHRTYQRIRGEDREEWLTEGDLVVRAGETLLTRTHEGEDGPTVSAHPLAEWLAGNWWRIRTEGRPPEPDIDWWQSHNMMESAHGFVWPNITVWRKDDHLMVTSEATQEPSHLRYLGAEGGEPIPVSLRSFEQTGEEFIRITLKKLDQAKETETNLHLLYQDLKNERGDPELTQEREAEAREGRDPPYQGDEDKA